MVHNHIHEIQWHDVGGILSRGGTVIGTGSLRASLESAKRHQLAHSTQQ
jgi:6-phosphofructokinase